MASMIFRYQGASAKLFCIDADERRWEIRNLQSREPRMGHAREVIQQVVDHADEYGWTLQVVAQQFGRLDSRGMNNQQLVSFYESFDFEVVRKKPPTRLERLPH